MGEPQKFALIKMDEQRGVTSNFQVGEVTLFFGNACVSRKLIVDSNQQADRAAIISKYKVGQLVEGTVKAISSFGFFSTVDNQIDTLTHLVECSWQELTILMN